MALSFSGVFLKMRTLGERLHAVLNNDDESYYTLLDVISKIKSTILKGTPADTMAFRNAYRKLMSVTQMNAIQKRVDELCILHEAEIKRIQTTAETGDKEFDSFRRMVLAHDYYYSYSDDGKVWRIGEAERKAIEDIVSAKGGLYLTYWAHYQASHDASRVCK